MVRCLLAFLLVSYVAGAAFVPAVNKKHVSSTAVQFGFLKDMGIEKPSWLPDFGGKEEVKKVEEPVAVAEGESEEAEEAPVAEE
jgi:hypothetical protein